LTPSLLIDKVIVWTIAGVVLLVEDERIFTIVASITLAAPAAVRTRNAVRALLERRWPAVAGPSGVDPVLLALKAVAITFTAVGTANTTLAPVTVFVCSINKKTIWAITLTIGRVIELECLTTLSALVIRGALSTVLRTNQTVVFSIVEVEVSAINNLIALAVRLVLSTVLFTIANTIDQRVSWQT
jgi:hypothetical protein